MNLDLWCPCLPRMAVYCYTKLVVALEWFADELVILAVNFLSGHSYLLVTILTYVASRAIFWIDLFRSRSSLRACTFLYQSFWKIYCSPQRRIVMAWTYLINCPTVGTLSIHFELMYLVQFLFTVSMLVGSSNPICSGNKLHFSSEQVYIPDSDLWKLWVAKKAHIVHIEIIDDSLSYCLGGFTTHALFSCMRAHALVFHQFQCSARVPAKRGSHKMPKSITW